MSKIKLHSYLLSRIMTSDMKIKFINERIQMAKQNKKLCGSQGNANINVSLLYNHQTGENFKRALALIAGGENG